MGLLTGFIEGVDGFLRSNEPAHPVHGRCIKPTGMKEKPKPHCLNCPQVNKTGHESYGYAWRTQPVDGDKVILPWMVRTLQYLLRRVKWDIVQPEGTQAGWLINGCGNLNFTSMNTVRVIDAGTDTGGPWIDCQIADGTYDPRAMTWGMTRYIPEDSIFYAYSSLIGPVQAGDNVLPLYPSCLAEKAEAQVKRVVITTAGLYHTARLYLDHDFSNILKSAERGNAEPEISVRLDRQAGPIEKFMRVVTPVYRKTRKVVRLVKVDDLPENGLYELTRTDKSSGYIAWPKDALPPAGRKATFELWKELENGTRVNMTTLAKSRIQILDDGDGADGKGRWKTWLCFKDAVPGTEITYDTFMADDLADAVRVVITYYAQATDSEIAAGDYEIPTGHKCGHAIWDENRSEYNAPDGYKKTTDGETHYCVVRRWATRTIQYDENGKPTEVVTWHTPKGVSQGRFKPSCSLYGVCDKFVPIEDLDSGGRVFNLWTDFAPVIRQMMHSANVTLTYGFLGSYANSKLCRVEAPSVASLLGSWPRLEEWQRGAHDYVTFPDWGLLVGGYNETVNGTGDKFINGWGGFDYSNYNDISTVDVDSPLTFPSPGVLPMLIPGFTSKRDPYGESLTSLGDWPNDPWGDIQNSPWGAGYGATAGEGTNDSRDLSRRTRLTGETPILCEDIDLEKTNVDQDRGDAICHVLSTPVVHNAIPMKVRIRFPLLITNGKSPVVVATGKIAAASLYGSGKIKLELENIQDSYTVLVSGSSSESSTGLPEDKSIVWSGPFGFVSNPPWLTINSLVSRTRTRGPSNRKCWVGDALQIDRSGVDGIPDSEKTLWPVWRAKGAGGDKAEDWGPKVIRSAFTVSGFFLPSTVNRTVAGVEDPAPVEATTATLKFAYPAEVGPTAVEFQAVPAFPEAAVVINKRTGELLGVTGLSTTLATATLTRGLGGVSPGDMEAGDVLELLLCVWRDGVNQWHPLEQMTGDKRPTITTGKFWVDPGSSRFYYAEADVSKKVRNQYRVAGKPENYTGCYWENWVIGAGNPQYNNDGGYSANFLANGAFYATDLSNSIYGAQTRSIATTGHLTHTETATVPPPAGQVNRTATTPSGNMLFRFNMAEAGMNGSLEQSTAELAPNPGDVPGMPPGYSTGVEYGKRRDVALIYASQRMRVAVASLVGCTVKAWRHGHGIDPTSTLAPKFSVYEELSQQAISSNDTVIYYGIIDDDGKHWGELWISELWYDSRISLEEKKVCFFL